MGCHRVIKRCQRGMQVTKQRELNTLLFWLPGIFDKFILFSSSGNVTFI